MLVDVVWINGHGCELRRERCEDITEATSFVSDMCRTGALEAGDTIKFEEVE